MILLTHQTRILLSIAPSDFRRGIDGHAAICQNELLLNPRDQSVYVFINKAKTMIRALSYDGSGYWLMTKRISRGKFRAGQPQLEARCLRPPHCSFVASWAAQAGNRPTQTHQYLQVLLDLLRLRHNTRWLAPRDTA